MRTQIENERLDTQYYILRVRFGDREYFAPLRNPRRMLDIGTGTGLWCIKMGKSQAQWLSKNYPANGVTAEMFPNAEVRPHFETLLVASVYNP